MKRLTYILSLIVVGLTPLDAITLSEGVTFGRIFYILLIISALLSKDLFKVRLNKYVGALSVFSLWAFVTFIWSFNIETTILRCLYLIQYLLLVIILNNVIDDERKFRALCWSWVVGALYIGWNTIVNFSQHSFVENELYRVSEFGNSNENSFMLCYAMVLLIVVWKGARRLYLYAILLFAFLAILANGSRTGLLMYLFMAGIFVLSEFKKNRRAAFFVLPAIIVIAIYIVLNYLPESSYERFLNISEDIKEGNLANRQWIWRVAFDILSQRERYILVGSGWGTFPEVFQSVTGIYYGSHNFYINILFTTGIVGFLIVMYYLIFCWEYIRRIPSKKITYYLLLYIPLISMMTTNWESRRWWFLMGVFIYKLYEFSITTSWKKTNE